MLIQANISAKISKKFILMNEYLVFLRALDNGLAKNN